MLGLVIQITGRAIAKNVLKYSRGCFIMFLELTPFDFENEMERSNSVI
jgi:hypothetical protein